jgi:hypothetical protein
LVSTEVRNKKLARSFNEHSLASKESRSSC